MGRGHGSSRGGGGAKGFQGDRSMRGMSAGLAKALTARESEIRDLPYENSAIFDEQGNALEITNGGANRRVGYDGILADGNIVTHNHPGGGSLSRKDILGAVSTNAKEVRAVAGDYTYSIKRPDSGWGVTRYEIKGSERFNYGKTVYTYGEKPGSIHHTPDASMKKLHNAYKIASRRIEAQRTKYISGSTDKAAARRRFDTVYSHLINKEYAKLTGFEYTKTRVR